MSIGQLNHVAVDGFRGEEQTTGFPGTAAALDKAMFIGTVSDLLKNLPVEKIVTALNMLENSPSKALAYRDADTSQKQSNLAQGQTQKGSRGPTLSS